MTHLPPSDSHPLTALNRHNFRHLYFDVGWWGVFVGTTIAFLTVYATRLGATPVQIGLFTSGVAVISLLISVPAGHWLEGRSLIRTVTRLAVWHRIWFAVLVVLPWWLGDNPELEVTVLIGLYLLAAVFGIVLGIAFNALFADIVPPEWRTHVVGRRLATHSIIVCLSSLATGQILDHVAFPLNYQIVFCLGAVGALMPCYHFAQLRSPTEPPLRVGRPINDLTQVRFPLLGSPIRLGFGLRFLTRSSGKPMLRWDLVRGPFGGFLGAYLILHVAIYLSIPLYPIFAVRELNLPDSVISVGPVLTYSIITVISLLAPRLRLSDHRLVSASVALYGLQPFCLMLAYGADGFYWAAALAVGAGAAMLGIGLTSRLMARVPEDDRPAHMALYNLALYMGVLIGSGLGPWLGDAIGLRATLGIGAASTLLCTVWIARWG